MISIQDMKKLRDIIADSFGVSPSVAGRVIGYYNGSGRGEIVAAMIAGDLSGVAPALAALGESIPEKGPAATTAASDPGTANKISTAEKISDNSPEKISGKRSAQKTARNASRGKEKKTSATPSQDQHKSGAALGVAMSPAALQTGKDQLETVAGEIVQNDLNGLPAGTTDMIMSYIEMWCKRDNITDLKKERQITWKALCMELGMSLFKKSKILHDVQREKTKGGIYYNYDALNALCDFWSVLCYRYNKTPMIDDFARMAGVSDAFIYGTGAGYTDQQKVTPARTALLKKLHVLQESGLSGLIVDGRQNPTGALAALNHWHGWTQTREIIHTAAGSSQTAAALPVFDGSGGILPDKSTQ